jgi:hypothetical protein
MLFNEQAKRTVEQQQSSPLSGDVVNPGDSKILDMDEYMSTIKMTQHAFHKGDKSLMTFNS